VKLPAPIDSMRSQRSLRRSVPWIGALFIAVIVAVAALDVVRSYRETIAQTGRELDTQARIIAEQTARTFQAVDVVLRHIQDQYRQGVVDAMSPAELHAYLRDQTVGLVQINGLVMVAADGTPRANSLTFPLPESVPNVGNASVFQEVRDERTPRMVIGNVTTSPVDQAVVFPMVRRLETASGQFAGGVGARGRVDYFQQFYRDVQSGPSTKITLLRRDGMLLARQPPAAASLGKRLPLPDEMLAANQAGRNGPVRAISPIDGVDRFGALQPVPDYPLVVIITRDASAALAPWREAAISSGARTLALAGLAAALLALATRQLGRLDTTRQSLETARERFSLAVSGADVGIWDWNQENDEMYGSARARELLGMGPGPETESSRDWFGQIHAHPDDEATRWSALEAHLAGKTPAYEEEFRVLHADGKYRWVRVRGVVVRDANGKPVRMAGSVSDVDTRRRAEQALRQSEERYAVAMTGSNEGHWVWNVQTDEIYSSPMHRELFGIGPDEELPTRTRFFQRMGVHPDDVAHVQQAMADHLAGNTPRVDTEFRVVDAKTGAVRWMHTRAQCSRDEEGRAERVGGATVEVSERKQAEEALRSSEERFALAVAGSKDGVSDWDIVSDRMFTSSRAMQICGVESDLTVRTRAEWLALIKLHPDDLQRYHVDTERHLSGEVEVRDGEYRFRHPDGEYRWVRIRGMSVRDAQGRAIRWAGSVSDIDAQKRVEQALRQSEERYQLAVDGSNEGLWDWDLRRDMLFLSARAQSLLGREPGEPLRPRREWIASGQYHPDDEPLMRKALSDHLRGLSPHFSCEYRIRHASGEWHWYRQRGVAVRDRRGRAYRVAGSMEDVTDRRTAEADRDRFEAQLRQAQKLEAIGTLAGGIAHDFNNILAAILGYGEMAQKEALEGTPQQRHIDAAMSAAMRAKSLVERILAFSRSGVGERVPVHVQTIVGEALEAVAASLPAGVALERSIECGDAAVLGDPTQLHQVVMNLCANAVQAMRSAGTLRVAVETIDLEQPQVVTTSTLPAGKYVRLEVEDSGVGIAPRVLERIFDPFFTTKEIGVGTGLGLSLVHGIVTDLGGGIDVRSELGRGTSLTVWVPWQRTIAAPSATPVPVPPGAGETVLIVDDEEALVRLGEEMMAELGYEPVGFASSTAALASFRATPERFQAVLSDESMPEMTGSELALELRRIRPDIPILLMSGYVTPALAARAREAGVHEVLAKPLVIGDIAGSLAKALQR
jgi:PAS domain S-box-containing protein